jgi:tRNA pseudouridine55 synthase
MELAARPLLVESLELIEMPDADHAVLEMTCGKGGYVRSIARDLGQALGCFGHVVQLRRVWAGPFEVSDGISFETLDEMAKDRKLDEFLLPLEAGLHDLHELACTPEGAAKMRNGNPGMVIASDVGYGEECWASLNGVPIAIGVYKSGELHPNRVFVLGD